MSYTATATLFYGTTFTLTELETVFNLVPGADNWFEIDRKLEENGLERVVRDTVASEDTCNIISGKTIQVDSYEGFKPISLEELELDIDVWTKVQSLVSTAGLTKEIGWYLCAGDI
jgi:hypothetical protein